MTCCRPCERAGRTTPERAQYHADREVILARLSIGLAILSMVIAAVSIVCRVAS